MSASPALVMQSLLAEIPRDPLAAFRLADHLESQEAPERRLEGELLRLTYALTRQVGGDDRDEREERLRGLLRRGVSRIGPRQWVDLGNSVIFKFVWVPPGRFLMGSPLDEPGRPVPPPDDPDSEEVDWPQHEVELTRGFWMGATPVTQHQFARVMGYNPSWKSSRTVPVDPHNRDRPVQELEWFEAAAFLDRLSDELRQKGRSENVRLPTEAEWEYACRAGTTSPYWSGRDEADLARVGWYEANSVDPRFLQGTYEYGPDIQPVGARPANPWGLHDMHGNVWEWCADWCAGVPAVAAKRTDPRLDDPESNKRVIRGGDAWDDAANCRSAARDGWTPDASHNDLGFRIVADRLA